MAASGKATGIRDRAVQWSAAWSCNTFLTHYGTLGTLCSEGTRRVAGMWLVLAA
jgi:hypothetical protein